MKKFLVSVAVAALAAPMFAQTTPARVAVIDVQKVLTQSTAGKSAYEKLKKMQDDRMEKAKGMDEELRKLDSDISTKRLSLSEDKLADMQKQLAEKRISMQRYAQDAEREIGEARDRELQALEAKIKPVIDGIGKEMGLAAIFNKFESGLVYASEAIDITDTVIKRFNEAQPAPAAAKK
ncbi:MAG TPA: OmpH family outer membrane protein [Thermoanaerobaculia bacterium]|jgi:outer membrane protein|nr:OmpH family outer membrane protein [Thermoanaerobaculia bacterium]